MLFDPFFILHVSVFHGTKGCTAPGERSPVGQAKIHRAKRVAWTLSLFARLCLSFSLGPSSNLKICTHLNAFKGGTEAKRLDGARPRERLFVSFCKSEIFTKLRDSRGLVGLTSNCALQYRHETLVMLHKGQQVREAQINKQPKGFIL